MTRRTWREQFEEAPNDWEVPVSTFAPWFRSDALGYERLLARLRDQEFRVRATCLVAPVQLAGFLPTGEAFCLRCRHETCWLTVAPADEDPVRSPTWEGKVSRWDREGASTLPAEETEAVLQELLTQYRRTEVT